jgi:hypothetical protein
MLKLNIESLDMNAFTLPPPKLTSKMPNKNSASNLEFVEEYYTIDENAHLFENAVICDETSEGVKSFNNEIFKNQKLTLLIIIYKDIMVEQQPKASETSRDDVVRNLDSESLSFSDNHFAVPSASELCDSSIQE